MYILSAKFMPLGLSFYFLDFFKMFRAFPKAPKSNKNYIFSIAYKHKKIKKNKQHICTIIRAA